jgi:hypothetical protein
MTGAKNLVLGKSMRLLLILLDISFIFYTIVHMVLRLAPVDQPVYWIAGALEVGLAFLAYRYWMQSWESKGFNSDRIKTLVIAAAAIALPYILDAANVELLKPAVSTDFFFYCAALTLLIYSSYRINSKVKGQKARPNSD